MAINEITRATQLIDLGCDYWPDPSASLRTAQAQGDCRRGYFIIGTLVLSFPPLPVIPALVPCIHGECRCRESIFLLKHPSTPLRMTHMCSVIPAYAGIQPVIRALGSKWGRWGHAIGGRPRSRVSIQIFQKLDYRSLHRFIINQLFGFDKAFLRFCISRKVI